MRVTPFLLFLPALSLACADVPRQRTVPMRRTLSLWTLAVAGLVVALATPAAGQTPKLPAISARSFVSGSVNVTVKGSFQIAQDVVINTRASTGDGEMTWLQFGASGSAEPNALITVGDQGLGINVGKGKQTATADEQCSGKLEVTATSVSGQYTCTGVVSYDAATRKMGKIDIEIRFTAKS